MSLEDYHNFEYLLSVILSDLNYMNLDNYIENKFFISDYEYNFFIHTLKKIKASQYSFFRKYYESNKFDKQFYAIYLPDWLIKLKDIECREELKTVLKIFI